MPAIVCTNRAAKSIVVIFGVDFGANHFSRPFLAARVARQLLSFALPALTTLMLPFRVFGVQALPHLTDAYCKFGLRGPGGFTDFGRNAVGLHGTDHTVGLEERAFGRERAVTLIGAVGGVKDVSSRLAKVSKALNTH